MKRKLTIILRRVSDEINRTNRRFDIFTTLLLCVTLFAPLSLFGQSADFVMNGTTLVRYNGNAANVTIPKGVTIPVLDRRPLSTLSFPIAAVPPLQK
jgi:hypothetical protein